MLRLVMFQLRLPPWRSPLQLLLGGLMIYLMASIAGPYYGCGAGNLAREGGIFQCEVGELSVSIRTVMIACIASASLCWGRALSVAQKRRESSDQE